MSAAKAPRQFRQKLGESHRSGVTSGDLLSHALLTEAVEKIGGFPFSEEGQHDWSTVLKLPNAWIFDPIDGTAPFSNALGTWCVGIASARFGVLNESAIYAPELNGGMLVSADKYGAYVALNCAATAKPDTRVIAPREPVSDIRKAVIAMGVDSTQYPACMSCVPTIAKQVRAWTLANSGLLALAQVGCGFLDAVIQTPQKCWDWAPAYRIVTGTGNMFQFFRFSAGDAGARSIEFHDSYDERAFMPDRPSRMGFIAGRPEVVEFLKKHLPTTGW